MPVKIEQCVEKVVKEKGISKEKAFAICTASINASDNGMIIDSATTIKATIDPDSKFLTASVVLARTGVQYYYGYELGIDDRTLDKIGVYRSPEEVFNSESMQSYINLPVVDDHPVGIVSTDDIKKLQKGSVSEIKREGQLLKGIITITDEEQISKIKNGKSEVSLGYKQKLLPLIGSDSGESYEFIQTRIKGNHLAIVDAGRCGAACKLTLDHKNKGDNAMIKITLDGITFKVEDEQLAQAIEKTITMHDEETKELKKKLDAEEELKKKAEKEKEDAEKEKEKAEGTKDALKKTILNDEAINKLVAKRADLLVVAKAILGDSMPECSDCPKEIQAAVIEKVLGIKDVSDKSVDALQAMYEVAVKKVKDAKGSLDDLNSDFIKNLNKDTKDDKGKTKDTRESVRETYVKDTLNPK